MPTDIVGIAFRLIVVTACMASTGGQKMARAPNKLGQTGIEGQLQKNEIFRPPSFS